MLDIKSNVLLKDYSNYKIGGPARLFAEVETVEDLSGAQRFAQNDRVFVLGGGTNLLISDKGFDGCIIHNNIKGFNKAEGGLEVGSGVLIKDLLDFCIENSLSGLEWAGGLPGTVGGAVRGNAGAFGGETKDNIAQVKSLDLLGEEKERSNEECNFGYRNSVFKLDVTSEIITTVVFNLKEGNKIDIQKQIQEKIDYRNLKHPMNYLNIGSTFKNIPFNSLSHDLQKEFAPFVKTDPFFVVPTTKLLALCGLKGRKVGGAMISDKHPNFIVNIDNAKAEDVKELIKIAKESVKQKYGIGLEEEIIYLE